MAPLRGQAGPAMQLYENIHPNLALVQLKLNEVQVYWRDRVEGLLGSSTVSNACSFEYVEALDLKFGGFPQILTQNNLVGHIIVQGTMMFPWQAAF